MNTNFSFSNSDSIDISFMINECSDKNLQEDDKTKKNTKNIELKEKLPKNKIFRINSLFYNIQKQCKEVHDQYYCIYSEKNNYLYLIFNTKFNYSEFTKDWLINILDFSVSVGIDSICLLVAKNNKMYLNIIQDMLIVGFEPMENVPKITIDGNVYKTLKMPTKDIYQEIKEIILV